MPDPVKDLPDPLEEQVSTPGDNPDDLVAQLADEAIDKLIADADRGEAPAPQAPETSPAIREPAAPSGHAPEPEPIPSEPLQNQLDSLFTQLADDPKPAAAPSASESETDPGAPVETDPAPTSVAPMSMPPPVDVPPEIAGLAQDHPADAEPTLQADVRALLDDATHAAPGAEAPSFIVKPLEWLNAPFAGLSDDTRDTLGQIAVVTLINALAVILYVILFRRP